MDKQLWFTDSGKIEEAPFGYKIFKKLSDEFLDLKIELSKNEQSRYNFPVDETNLIKCLERSDYFVKGGNRKSKNQKYVIEDYTRYTFMINQKDEIYPNVPSRLFQSISEYSGKKLDDIVFSDLVQMYKSAKMTLSRQDIGENILYKWKKANNLKFFGHIQFELLEYFVNKIKMKMGFD